MGFLFAQRAYHLVSFGLKLACFATVWAHPKQFVLRKNSFNKSLLVSSNNAHCSIDTSLNQ